MKDLLASFDDAAQVTARAKALFARLWTPIVEWAERSGVAATLRAWYLSSGLPAWLASCRANIEKRRQQRGM